MRDGFVPFPRAMLDDPVLSTCEAFTIFGREIILKAAHKPTRVRFRGRWVNLEAGQVLLSIRGVAKDLGINKDKVHRVLKAIQKCDIIETDSETGTLRITVCNWVENYGFNKSIETPLKQDVRQERDTRETQNNKVTNKQEQDTPPISPPQPAAIDHAHPDDEQKKKHSTWSNLPKNGRNKIYPEAFEHFWSTYPTDNSNSKKSGYQGWVKLANDADIGPRELWKAAERYRREIDATGKYPKGMGNWFSEEICLSYLADQPHSDEPDLFGGGRNNGSIVPYANGQQHHSAFGSPNGKGMAAAAARCLARRQRAQ